ncbi:MAG: 3-oxoacyl-[acyl-carrier-protein] reductase [Deltaproteobacteria bacterium]|nr:3-oxoacyl-[acyl-carrier-protein] reductase [Deltaproteobacteria bacterium]
MSTKGTLTDRVALVTGGGRGIGRAICQNLAASGATVLVNYSRSEDDARSVVAEIVSNGGRAEFVKFDVGTPEDVERGVNEAVEKVGKIDILVNNAGIAVDGLLVRTKNVDWDRTIDVNLSGPFYCCRAVAKSMMKQRYGRIINISSIIGQMGNGGQAAYSASKAGLIGLTKSVARELASRNITVNAVTPGYIVTDMTTSITEDLREQMLRNIPLARLGSAEEVASVVAFLASDASAYVTGQVIAVNGGMYM